MLNFLFCSNLNNNKEVDDTKFELNSNPSIKQNTNKEITSMKNNNLKTSMYTYQSFIYIKTTFEEKEKEKEELNIIEYPEIKKKIVQKSLVNNNNNINTFIYKNYNFLPSKKIINEEDSSLIYFDEEYNISLSNNNKEVSNINNKYCIYCEEIYKKAFKNNELIKDKNCIYCNRLINIKTFEELIKDGIFQSDDDDESIIENCKSYYFEDKI